MGQGWMEVLEAIEGGGRREGTVGSPSSSETTPSSPTSPWLPSRGRWVGAWGGVGVLLGALCWHCPETPH